MSCVEAKKPHAVLVPFPAQGHITPFMQLAKLLHSKGFHITFINTEHNQRRLIRNKGPDSVKGLPDFRFEAIPDGLPPLDRDVTQEIPAVCESTQKHSLGPLLELLGRLNSSPDEVPRVTCIILDGAMGFAVKAAESLGVPAVVFWTLSACGFLGYLHYRELRRKGIFPFKDENFVSNGTLDTPLDWISGMSNIRLRDLPSFIRTTDPDTFMVSFMGSETINSLKASAVIFNTFEEFEHEALEAIAAMSPNVYAIGPLQLLERHMPETNCKSYRSNLWKEDSNCLEWLDEREPSSVVYVNYGSVTVMTEEQLKEFASGLANSKHPFLWVVRPDVAKGQSSSWLQEYIEAVKDSGLVVSWCPQDLVLQHPSIGVFLTHCGWNSTLETICGGVPVICWPFFAEQQTNCRYACTTWGIGMEVNEDVKHDEVEAFVREMMECNNGKQRRLKALGWKKKAEAATDIGGSSYNNLERLIKEVLAGDG